MKDGGEPSFAVEESLAKLFVNPSKKSGFMIDHDKLSRLRQLRAFSSPHEAGIGQHLTPKSSSHHHVRPRTSLTHYFDQPPLESALFARPTFLLAVNFDASVLGRALTVAQPVRSAVLHPLLVVESPPRTCK